MTEQSKQESIDPMDGVTVRGSAELSVYDIVQMLRDDLNRDQITEFVLLLDQQLMDYHWTVNLRNRLNAEIAKEDEAWDANSPADGE